MRILLTGGAGFIGSHVTELLERKYPSYTVRRLNARSNAVDPRAVLKTRD